MSPIFVLNLPSPTAMATRNMKGYARPLLASVLPKTYLVRSIGYPLGLFSDYSNHGTEFSVKIKEREQNWVEVFTPDGRPYMSIIGRDKKFLFDNHGGAVLNVRNRAFNFGGQYQVGQHDHTFHQRQFSDHPCAGIRR